jgi:hypothetical protein
VSGRPPRQADPALLTLVRQCAIERDRADLAWLEALQTARDAGWSLQRIGYAAGISRQAVWDATLRPDRHGAPSEPLGAS